MSATIKDVSEASGISVATISKYLNNGTVRPRTAASIEAAIRKLNYVPNYVARSLRNSKSMSVGILVNDITNNFYNQIVSQLSHLLKLRQYSCLIQDFHHQDLREFSGTVSFLAEKQVDGVFVIASNLDSEKAAILKERFRNLVVIDGFVSDLNADFVLTDNLTAAYHATEQLIVRGHRDIALITGSDKYFSASERLNGYTRALGDYNIPIRDDLIKRVSYDMEGGYKAIKELYAYPAEKRPGAVLIASYFLTIGALIALNEYNVRIPQDLSLMCFDKYDINRVFMPALNCITQPVEGISQTAAEVMLKRLTSTEELPVQLHRIPARLEAGGSVRIINE